MCGRFIQSSPPDAYTLALGLEIAGALPVPEPRYNVAPSTPVLALRHDADGRPGWALLRWGLVPSWSKGPDRRYSMINARAETVAGRAAFREPFRRSRCIVPADGFYEWRTECHGRQPYLISRSDGLPLFFAGLWDHWQREDESIDSCAIVVTDANAAVAPIHDRMPVILSDEAARRWLDPDTPVADLTAMLSPLETGLTAIRPVSQRVNSTRNEGPELLQPPGNPCPGGEK